MKTESSAWLRADSTRRQSPSSATLGDCNAIKILIVEDDQRLNQQMSELVRNAGYGVDACYDGDDGLLAAAKQEHQLMLLDVMLPNRDGISVLSMLRKTSQMPVIIVTAKGAEEERITGLRQGADDYIAKPFNPTELLLRIEALLRRINPSPPPTDQSLSIAGLQLNLQTQQAAIEGQLMDLTPIQFKLLWELGLHRGEVLSKAYLSQQVLNRSLGAYDRGLDMHLCRVRRKLNDAGWRGDRLQTVHGEGYCLK